MTQETYERVFLEKPLTLEYVPYVSKSQRRKGSVRDTRAVKIVSRLLEFILD